MLVFRATLDVYTKIITSVVVVLGLPALGIGQPFLLNIILSCFPLTIVGIIYAAHMVRDYRITDDKLIIRRTLPRFNREIPLSAIQKAEPLVLNNFLGGVRLNGNGGILGYTGLFWNSQLGRYRMYATQGKNRILISLNTDGKESKVVISPDERDEMLEVLNEKLLGNWGVKIMNA